jgi:hypothetical protein
MANKKNKEETVEKVISSFKSRQDRLYSTDNIKEYQRSIEKMNLAELQDHAISLGFRPSHNRTNLEKTLVAQFHKRFGDIYKPEETKLSKEKQKKIDSVLQSWK